jgi:nitrite reductase/ring-hydroxylating ferredoxin subunit
MLSQADNELLCRVGPGTPMGALMREYWIPALRSDELPKNDPQPVRIMLLGEKLIAFRTTSGEVGLIQNSCPHRGASLYFGRNEEEGLRCVYHGWKFDVAGQCVDMLSEPEDSSYASKVRARVYPCIERAGIIWTYMGPSTTLPQFPDLEVLVLADGDPSIQPRVSMMDVNWFQAIENNIDTAHQGIDSTLFEGYVIAYLDADARPDEIAQGLVGSFTLGVGQFCTKPGLVLVPKGGGVEDAVVTAVAEAAGGTLLNDRIADSFADDLRAVLDTGRVEVLAGDPEHAVADGAASPVVAATSVADLEAADRLLEECFGPMTLLVRYADRAELEAAIDRLPGSLTVTVHAESHELEALTPVVERLRELAGRVIFGGWPTGVAVNWAQQHGGPWPSTTSSLHTSVGATAIRRFLRPVAYQNVPAELLPDELREDGTAAIPRRIDGRLVLPT